MIKSNLQDKFLTIKNVKKDHYILFRKFQLFWDLSAEESHKF